MISFLKKIVGAYLQKKALQLNKKYPNYNFGEGTYSSNLQVFSWNEGSTLKIGSYCSIADGVQIFLGGEHNADWVTTYPFSVLWKSGANITGHPQTKGDVTIGSDVWIGKDAMIMSGVTIGDGAVIGARALVTKDIAPYSIAAGNPVREINKRFNDKIIEKLLIVKWWDWDKNRIEKALPLLLSKEINSFLQAVENGKI
jgi:acetyltransferase-like isoleucine patch superfamily enzyme